MAHTAHVEEYYLQQGCCDSVKEEKEFLQECKALAKRWKTSVGEAASTIVLQGEGFFNLFSGYSESEKFEMINFIFEKAGIKQI